MNGFGQFQSPYIFNSGNDFPFNTGFGQPQSFYTLSGGTIRGAGIWNPDMRSIRPEVQAASRAMGEKGVMVLPSGAGDRQELRYMREQAEQQGYDWTEAPTKYTRGAGPTSPRNKNQPLDPTGFYDPQGRKFTGTQMWVGGGWGGHTAHGEAGRIETDKGSYAWGQQRGGYGDGPSDRPSGAVSQGSRAKAREEEKRREALAVTSATPFGQRVRDEEPTPSLAGSVTRWWDRSSPAFPFANY